MGRVEGAAARHRGGEAVAILVMLPVGVAWICADRGNAGAPCCGGFAQS